MTAFQLYPYQAQAVEDVRESLRRLVREGKRRRTLVVACTGSGKTEIFIEMILRVTAKGGRSLVLVHTKSLVDQTARRLRARGLRVGVERAAETVDQLLDVDVVVCSVQSMGAPAREVLARSVRAAGVRRGASHAVRDAAQDHRSFRLGCGDRLQRYTRSM